MKPIKAPFPYFGGKSRVASEVWQRFGDVKNYVEPFAGSCAVLLSRPQPFVGVETVNDADGLLANFWRAMVYDPEGVAHHADWPVNEADLHARHLWLIGQRESLTDRLMGDPSWYDVKAAGWWVWGACAWIGSGWCSGKGPWVSVDGVFQRSNAGQGVIRQLPHLFSPQGVNRQLPHLGDAGRGVSRGVIHHLLPAAERIKNVRVACGDWKRVLGNSATWRHGLTGVFLDPPYPEGKVDYAEGTREIYQDVQKWALENGDNPKLRIAVCGYENDHDALESAGWLSHAWRAQGGYGNAAAGAGRKNAKRETVWFSPHCIPANQEVLA